MKKIIFISNGQGHTIESIELSTFNETDDAVATTDIDCDMVLVTTSDRSDESHGLAKSGTSKAEDSGRGDSVNSIVENLEKVIQLGQYHVQCLKQENEELKKVNNHLSGLIQPPYNL